MQNISWSKLGEITYWLEGVAGSTSITPVVEKNSFYFWTFLYTFSAVLILGIVLRVSQAFLHANHPFQSKFPLWGNNFMWMGILGLTWFTLRQVSVGFLGARFWLIIGFVWLLFILYFIIRYFVIFWPLEISYFKKTFLQVEQDNKK
jgi:hypothetical protein